MKTTSILKLMTVISAGAILSGCVAAPLYSTSGAVYTSEPVYTQSYVQPGVVYQTAPIIQTSPSANDLLIGAAIGAGAYAIIDSSRDRHYRAPVYRHGYRPGYRPNPPRFNHPRPQRPHPHIGNGYNGPRGGYQGHGNRR